MSDANITLQVSYRTYPFDDVVINIESDDNTKNCIILTHAQAEALKVALEAAICKAAYFMCNKGGAA